MVEMNEQELREAGRREEDLAVCREELSEKDEMIRRLRFALMHARDEVFSELADEELESITDRMRHAFISGEGKTMGMLLGKAYKGFARAEKGSDARSQADVYNDLLKKYREQASRSGYREDEIDEMVLAETTSTKRNRAKYVRNEECEPLAPFAVRAYALFIDEGKKIKNNSNVMLLEDQEGNPALIYYETLPGNVLLLRPDKAVQTVSVPKEKTITGVTRDGRLEYNKENHVIAEATTQNIKGHYFKTLYDAAWHRGERQNEDHRHIQL